MAKNKYDLKSNKEEVDLSNLSNCFAKIIDYSDDYKYIKMEKIKIPPFLQRVRIAKIIRSKLKEENIFASDVLWYNVGQRKDGTLAIFDYGGAIIS